MAEHIQITDEDKEGMVPGRWYMFMVLGGFTYVGLYCGPQGFNKHKFKSYAHLANAGGLFLPDLCAGKWNENVKMRGPFPGGMATEVIQWHDYAGQTPWVDGKRSRR